MQPAITLRAACLGALLAATACPGSPSDGEDTHAPADTRAEADADAGPDVDVPELPPDCERDADCVPDGGVPSCRAVRCDDGACVLEAAPDGEACDDGDPCSGPDRCEGGACVAGDAPCDDDNPCTTDGCDPDFGCVHTFNQRPCDDGDGCTSGDACDQGACRGDAVDCDDDNPCTDDRCDADEGCVHTPRDGACDDGDACTTDTSCVDAVCQGGVAVTCGDPDNPCQRAMCDPITGCAVETLSGACDDGNACTEDDVCRDGICQGELKTCDDGNPCSDDYCDPEEGCLTADNVLPCDDGDPCTTVDRCEAGACVGTGDNPLCCEDVADCDDGDPCTVAACTGGLCEATPLDCDDDNPCSEDTCAEGACEHTPWGPVADTLQTIDDFEDGDGAWSVTSTNAVVTWQGDASMARGGAASFYLGDPDSYSYDFGETTAGAQRTAPIPPGAETLSLWYLSDLEENASCIYDVLRVYIDDVALEPPICASVDDWTEQTWDVSAWAGGTATLTLEFTTEDGTSNDGMGVWIDDITLAVGDGPACCLDAADCPDDPDDPCAVPVCEDARCGLDTSACR